MSAHLQNQAALITAYTSNARFNSRHSTALAMQLRRAAPTGLSADQAAALAAVSARASEVEQVRKARSRTAPSAQRVPRLKVIAGWNALRDSLGAMATIPPELGNEGQEAQYLNARLFPEGLSFVQLDAVAVWSQSKEMLERLEEEGLSARVNALIHPKLLASVTRAFGQLGEAIGVSGEFVSTPPSRGLAEANARFSYAVCSYARALSVSVTLEDHASFQRFLDALAPMDTMRVTSTAENDDEDANPEDGEPEVEKDEGSPMPSGPVNEGGPFTD